jgi:hypothetical protein
MSKQEAWMELSIGGMDIVVEKSIGLKLYDILTSGEGVHRRHYDWEDKMHWVDVLAPDQVCLKYIPAGEFGIMKIVGANKLEERRQKERIERELRNKV